MKHFSYIIMFLLLFGQTGFADDKESAKKILKDKLDGVLIILQSEGMEKTEKKQKLSELVEPVFDFSLMAKLTLGKKYWPGLTAEEKSRFTETFTRNLKESYLEKMMLYTDEKIGYKETVQTGKKVHITTLLVSGDNKIEMLYKMYRSKKGWLIYDIEIQGISIITTYKSQFDQVLTKGNINDLLLELEKKEAQSQ